MLEINSNTRELGGVVVGIVYTYNQVTKRWMQFCISTHAIVKH